MRLFISCELDTRVTDYLKELSKRLPEATLTIPRAFDLTMKFLGETPPDVAEKIQMQLQMFHFSPFEVALQGIDVFSRRDIRVVWVGVNPKEPFHSLHESLEKLLLPFFPADTKFVPHLTLARVKSVPDRKKFLAALADIKVEPMPFTIEKLILFRSDLSKEGATHSPLCRFG